MSHNTPFVISYQPTLTAVNLRKHLLLYFLSIHPINTLYEHILSKQHVQLSLSVKLTPSINTTQPTL